MKTPYSGNGSVVGVPTRVRSRAWFGSWSGSGSLSLSWSRSGFGFGSGFGKLSWSWSQIETCQLLASRTQNTNLKVTDISSLKPRIFSSKQRQLGFKLNGNQLVLDQEIKKISSKFIGSGVPILILKEVEIIVRFLGKKRKMNFCLVGESFWLVSR